MSRVLVVDDEPMMVKMAGFILKKGGHSAQGAFSAQEALDKISVDPPEFIIIDCEMPGMSGLELLEKIKNDPAAKNIPVCMMTGTVTDKTTAKAVSLGAVGCIEKPLKPAELLAVLR